MFVVFFFQTHIIDIPTEGSAGFDSNAVAGSTDPKTTARAVSRFIHCSIQADEAKQQISFSITSSSTSLSLDLLPNPFQNQSGGQ